MKMKSMYFVAGLLLMIVQSSWQSALQETEEKSRLFKASQAEPLDESRQLNEVKRHSQGTFTSDYSKFLDTRRAQDFVEWLMSSKRSGQQRQEETEKGNLLDQLSSNGLARRHAEYERHADGTYTSDISSYLEEQAAKEFIAWLMSGRGRRDLSEGTAKAVNIARRYSEGTYNSDLHEILDEIATQEFLNWLLEAKMEDDLVKIKHLWLWLQPHVRDNTPGKGDYLPRRKLTHSCAITQFFDATGIAHNCMIRRNCGDLSRQYQGDRINMA